MTNFLKSVILKTLFLFLCGLIPQIILFSQATGDPKEDFLYGEYYVSQNLYQNALPFYLSALSKNPGNSNMNYRIGQCFLRIIGSQENAIPYLEKAVENIDEHYVAGRYKDPAAPIEAWLFLGDAYHRENRLKDASKAYHEYRRLLGDSDDEMYELVMQKISGLGISYEFQRSEDEIKLINLGIGINSRFSDYNPVLSGDQKTLVYTQFWESYDRIMEATLTPSGWTKPRDISTELNTQGHCYSVSMSHKGKELYLVCHELEQYDIYVSTRTDTSWTPIKPIAGKVNSRWRESSASISSDGAELYFSSDRPGGEGGFDIYKAQKEGNEWTEIENMGSMINTDKNEEAPYLSKDGNIMYFSSNGHATIGNMDIIYSEMTPEGIWSRPVNMGSPVNTTADEIFYVYFKETKTGYLSRDLKEGFGKNDIYIIQHGLVLSTEINPIIDTTNGILVVEMKKGNSIQPYIPKSQIRDAAILQAVDQRNTPSYFQETEKENKTDELVQTDEYQNDNTPAQDNTESTESGEYDALSTNLPANQLQEASAVPGVSPSIIVAGAVGDPKGNGVSTQSGASNKITADSEALQANQTEASQTATTERVQSTQVLSSVDDQNGNSAMALNTESSQKVSERGNSAAIKSKSGTKGNNISAGPAAAAPAGATALAPAASATAIAAGVVAMPGSGNNTSGNTNGNKGRENKNASVDSHTEQGRQASSETEQYQETISVQSKTTYEAENRMGENSSSATNSATSQDYADDGRANTTHSAYTSVTSNSGTNNTVQQQETVKSISQSQQSSDGHHSENFSQEYTTANELEQSATSSAVSNNAMDGRREASLSESEYSESSRTNAGNTANQSSVQASSEIYYSESNGTAAGSSATSTQLQNSNTSSQSYIRESEPVLESKNQGTEYHSSAGNEKHLYTEVEAGNDANNYQGQGSTRSHNNVSEHSTMPVTQSGIEHSGTTASATNRIDQQSNNTEAVNAEQNISAAAKSTEQGFSNSNYRTDFSNADSIPTYTIQIYALQNPIPPNKIELSPLVVSAGADGLTRYTWGEFTGYSKALDLLDTIRRNGYPDAFIRNISTVENYGTKN